MILSNPADLIENPLNKELIKKARKTSDKLNMHVNGVGLDKHFEQLKSYENDNQIELRRKYARSNKALFSELLRPLDKIYTARGGAKYYNLPEGTELRFKNELNDIKNGISVSKWLQDVWRKKKITDPNGIILIEISKDGKEAYPTYKSIYSIYDYLYNGSKVEYVIFEPEVVEVQENNEKVKVERFRVIDDSFDYIIERKNGVCKVVESETFPNYFQKVPARIISDEEDENTSEKLSFIDSVVEIAEEILVDNSIKIIFKYTHGFPGYWEIERVCPVCHGEKVHMGHTCEACEGTGIRLGRDISDKIVVTMDEAGKAGAIPPAGYVSTDVQTWMQMNNEADLMQKLIHKAQWGTLALMSEKEYQKATPNLSDLQPVYDKLNTFSTEAENMEKFVTDILGLFYFKGQYKGSTIIYGKRFSIEGPDQIWKKFTEGKTGNLPEQILRNILLELIQSQYEHDPYEMSIQSNILKADPYPIYTASELKTLGFDIKDIYRKIYFTQWTGMIDKNNFILKPIETLIKERDEFINSNIQKYASLQTNLQPAGITA